MATSLRAFHVGLYDEHLEDIAFLRDQCVALRRKATRDWRAAASFEDRLEAHVDGLVVGGELALDVCRRAEGDAEAGGLFGIASVYCRQHRAPLLAALLDRLDAVQPACAEAVADALRADLPADWEPFIVRALERAPSPRTALLAAVAGHRRLPAARDRLQFLADAPHGVLQVVEALGRYGAHALEPALRRGLANASEHVRAAAWVALARVGSGDAMRAACDDAAVCEETHEALGLGGPRAAVAPLLDALRTGRATPRTVRALGLLGDPSSLEPLCDSLSDPVLAEPAAHALQWTTGAPSEEVFVPEEVDEDTLLARERQAWRQLRQRPLKLDGQPFGETRTGPSLRPAFWRAWLAANGARLRPGLRHRGGMPTSPAVLLAGLVAPDSPGELRRASALELEIRYGCRLPFEIDMTVRQQQQAIARIARWVEAQARAFQPGRWYFDARPQ